jgi:putative phosphoribosyl transferase
MLRREQMSLPFRDRAEAGRRLATDLERYRERPDVLVLALPRGGVPVASEVARALGVPFDVFVVRKLGVPGREELAMGAIASGGIRVLDPEIVSALGISEAEVELVAGREVQELARREQLYRGDRPAPELRDKIVILVDDGLATGSSMRAAAAAVRDQRPARVVVAVPTAPAETCSALAREVDEVVCSMTPEPFQAVGLWYEDFSETSDDDIRRLLADGARQDDRS